MKHCLWDKTTLLGILTPHTHQIHSFLHFSLCFWQFILYIYWLGVGWLIRGEKKALLINLQSGKPLVAMVFAMVFPLEAMAFQWFCPANHWYQWFFNSFSIRDDDFSMVLGLANHWCQWFFNVFFHLRRWFFNSFQWWLTIGPTIVQKDCAQCSAVTCAPSDPG